MASNNRKTTPTQAHIDGFVNFMERKGYRDRFRLQDGLYSDKLNPLRSLEDCLSTWLDADFKEGGLQRPLYLSYQFYSSPHRENIDCRFELKYSQGTGVMVSRIRLELGYKVDEILMKLGRNNDIPGFQTVAGLFKQKKPWEDHMRGRFR